MMRRTTLSTVVAVTLLFGTGACDKLGIGKGKDSAEASASASAATPAPTPVADLDAGALKDGEVATYPTQTPQGGTRVLNQGFVVYQAADRTSKVLGNLAPGTWVNLKASLANWLLIEWPSGVGQLSPGWIEATVNDRRIPFAPDAGIGDGGAGFLPPSLQPDASVPTTPSAQPVPSGQADAGRGRLRIPVTR
jgi:hypothetical protein